MAVDLKKLDRLYNNTQTVPQAKKSMQGGIDMDRLSALYNNAPEPKVRQEQNFSAPVFEVKEAETKQPVNNTQRRNYEQMQGLFNRSKKSDEEELNRINTEISAISGYGVGADRSRLQQLFREKDAVEQRLKVGRYDEDLTALERVQLSAQGIGEGYDAAAGVLADTAVQAVKDTAKNIRNDKYKTLRKQQLDTDNQISLLERRAGQGVLDAAGFAQLAELRKQKEKQAENVLQYRTPLDMDADSMQAMKRAMQAQQQATYGMGEGAATAYSVGVSIADSASRMPLMLIPVIGPALSAGVTSARIAAEKAYDVGGQGKTAAEALTRGAVSGGIEYFAEKYGLDELGKLVKSGAGRTYLKTFFKDAAENLPSALKSAGKFAGNMHRQGKAEASEEFVSYVLNFVADAMANDPNAKFSLEDAAVATLGGYVSGGVFGAGGQIADYAVNRNVQQDVTDTDVGNKIAEDTDVPGKNTENAVINAGFENETAKNVIKNGESVIISEKIDSTGAINAAENADLQSTAKAAERQALEKQVQEIVGIDTRTEVEKVTAEQQERIANIQQLADKGIVAQKDVDRVVQDGQNKIAEAVNKQANLDYQKLDADSGRVRQSLIDSGRGKIVENIERFANKRGLKVKYYSADADSAGNGFIDGDTIYINVQDGDVMYKTAIHETIHGLRSGNHQEYTKLYNSIMDYAEQYRALHDVADSVMAAYTNPDSVAYSSVLDEAGTVDADKLGEEVLCKLCEEVIKDPEGFIRNVDGNRTVLDAVADLLRKIKNSLAITLTNSEKAKLDNAVMAIERYVRNEGGKSKRKFSAFNPERRAVIERVDSNLIIEDDVQLERELKKALSRKGTGNLYGLKTLYLGVADVNVIKDIKENIHEIAPGKIDDVLKDNVEYAISIGPSEIIHFKKKNLSENDVVEYVKRVPDIISKFDDVIYTVYQGGHALRFSKTFSDGKYYAVTVVSNKKQTLSLHNVFMDKNSYQNKKRSAAPPLPANKPGNTTPKANGGLTSSNNNVSHFTVNGNGNNLFESSKRKHSIAIDNAGNNLTEEQSKFFAKSKVRDNEGNLKVMYHGTTHFGEITKFKTGKSGYLGPAIYLVEEKRQAERYANAMGPGNGELYEVYVNAVNPLVVNTDNPTKEILKVIYGSDRIYNNRTAKQSYVTNIITKADIKKLQALGYDAIYWDFVAEKELAVFNSNQIKRTDNKNPTSSEDIRHSINSGSGDVAENLKGKTIRERIEARANSGVTAKSVNVQTKAENALIRTISNAFGVKYTDKQGIIKEMVKEISAQVKATGAVDTADIDRLVDTAFSKGVISSNEKAKMYPSLKAELRESRFKYRPSEVFQNMRNNYFGKLRFAKDGTDVDVLYQQYNERYPDLFPEDITNPEDQIVRIGEVYDSLAENEKSLAEYYGDSSEEMKNFVKEDLQYAIGRYIQELQGVERYEADKRITAGEKAVAKDRKPPTMAEYKAAQDEAHRAQKAVDKLMRDTLLTDKEMRLIDTLLKGGDPDTVTGPNREKIIAVYAAKKAVKDARAPIRAYQADVLRKRNDVADDVLTTFRSWKDKKLGLGYSTETFERNILDIVPDKAEAQRIIDTYITPVHTAEAQSNRLKKAMRDRVRALNIDSKANNRNAKLYEVSVYDKSKPYTLQADESGLVQLYGEKKITKEQLEKVGADVSKIENAVAEFRKIYEELYEQANNALLRNGYAPLGKIKDYFPHFTEENDTVLTKMAAKAGFEVQTNRLPTSIAGLTETFKPGKNWWGNMQHRTGDTTLFDAVAGFDQYVEGVANIINQTDNIQNLRALENRLRYLASDEGVRTEMDRIDTLDISESEKYDLKQQLKDEVKNSSLPNFVTYLRDYTNNLAGKKDFSDRQIEHDFGRGIYTVSKALEGRIASNMIGMNVGSALTNFIPIAQAKAAIKTKYLVNAMNDTVRAFYGHDNGFENESDFLTNRFGSDKLVYTRAQKMSNMAGWLMNVCDRFTSNVVTRARYLQNIDVGMSSDEAMAEANSFAAGLIADRSKGAVPLVFERKNPIVKAVTMFQVEQNNQLRYLIKDLPKDFEKKGITALVWAVVQYAVASWLYNELYKIFAGRRPAFDPIDIGFGIVKDAKAVRKGEMKASAALTNAATAIAEEVPFVSGLAGGGRMPISSALPDGAEVVKLFDSDVSAEKKKSIAKKELTKPLWYLAAPTGGGQLKKAAEAAELYGKNKGVQYSVQSDGSKKVQFAKDPSVGAVAQSAVFGKWASEPAQEYINSGFKGLTKGQTENFELYKSWGMSNSEAFAKAKGTTAMSDKQADVMAQLTKAGVPEQDAYTLATTYRKEADTDGNGSVKTAEAKAYIDKLDMTREQKALLFSCMCPNVKNNPYK